jgi:hypothetical protein
LQSRQNHRRKKKKKKKKGNTAARAVAQRAKVAGHTLHRPRAAPNVRDALLVPATVGRLGFSGFPLD